MNKLFRTAVLKSIFRDLLFHVIPRVIGEICSENYADARRTINLEKLSTWKQCLHLKKKKKKPGSLKNTS